MPENLSTSTESFSSRSGGTGSPWTPPLRLDDILGLAEERSRAQNETPAWPETAGADDEPETFDELFQRLRDTVPGGSSGYKQFITNLADRVQIDWEGLLHGRTWEALAIVEIEDAIVLGILRKTQERLPEARRGEFAGEWNAGGGDGAMLDGIAKGDAKVLAKLDGPRLHLLRTITWDLSKGAMGRPSGGLASGKSMIYSNVEISGSIEFKGELIFGGRLKKGAITGDSLVVEKEARIKGDVMADALKLSGKVAGNVTAMRICELDASAEVVGDLTAQRISIEEGATLVGQVNIGAGATTADFTNGNGKSGG